MARSNTIQSGDVAISPGAKTVSSQPLDIDPDVRAYHKAFDVFYEYIAPFWDVAQRLYELWRGKLPEQLEATFTQAMLNVAYAIINERIPMYNENLFGYADFVTLDADNPLAELFVHDAEAWVRHMLKDESRLNIIQSIQPTLQSAAIMGNGFRMPYVTHRKNERTGRYEPLISSRDADYFQIMPAPNSGLVNPMDRESDDCLDSFMFTDWWTDDQIKALRQYKGAQKDQIDKCLAAKKDAYGQYNETYYDRFNILGGVSFGSGKSDWRNRMLDIENTKGRRRVVQWFKRDGLEIYAQDVFKLYKGPAVLPRGLLPLCNYKCVPDFKNFQGISNLEMVEDLVIVLAMNFNYRQDWLTRIMFPAKWIRADVLAMQPGGEIDDRPYVNHPFPTSVPDIQKAIWYDRMPEISPQHFMDEDRAKMFLQFITGQPNYSHGLPSQSTIENRTATGIVSLIRAAQGRLTTESLCLEEFGLRQEVRLLLALAEKHIHEDVFIRLSQPDGGFRWTTFEAEALAEMYTVKTHGTRYAANREQAFQKAMALYPMWNQDPYINPMELRRQMLELASDAFPQSERIIMTPSGGMGAEMGMRGTLAPGIGGAAAPQSLENRNRGMATRRSPQARTGRMIPANTAF